MSLKDAALAVRKNAHAPYSNFLVGAALRTPAGNVYVGCNVENVAYPEGTCAEAGAIAAMVAAGERELAEVYVVADSPAPVPPCGGCRQKLKEFGASHPEHWHSPGQVTAAKGVRSLVHSRDHQGDHSRIKF